MDPIDDRLAEAEERELDRIAESQGTVKPYNMTEAEYRALPDLTLYLPDHHNALAEDFAERVAKYGVWADEIRWAPFSSETEHQIRASAARRARQGLK